MGAGDEHNNMAEPTEVEGLRKKNPHRFIVDDALNDDNSTVTFHPDVMEEMDFFRGGHVKIRGKRQKLTVAVSLPDDTCEVPKVRMNKVMRKNLKVHLGDVVIVHNCEDCKYGKRIHVLPFEDSIEGVTGNLFDTYLKPYFMEAVVLPAAPLLFQEAMKGSMTNPVAMTTTICTIKCFGKLIEESQNWVRATLVLQAHF